MAEFPSMPPMTQFPAHGVQQPPTSGMAIASLVLGILGFCTAGLTGLIGLPLGIVAINAINRNPQRVGGRGLAIAGTIVSSVAIVSICLQLGLLLPALNQARQNARMLRAQQELRQVGLAFQSYAMDFNCFPPAANWQSTMEAYDPSVTASLNEIDERAFAMNINLDGAPANQVRNLRTVLLVEVEPGGPSAGGPELLTQQHGRRRFIVLYADGTSEVVSADNVRSLQWTVR